MTVDCELCGIWCGAEVGVQEGRELDIEVSPVLERNGRLHDRQHATASHSRQNKQQAHKRLRQALPAGHEMFCPSLIHSLCCFQMLTCNSQVDQSGTLALHKQSIEATHLAFLGNEVNRHVTRLVEHCKVGAVVACDLKCGDAWKRPCRDWAWA